jgi:hypothetical protein
MPVQTRGPWGTCAQGHIYPSMRVRRKLAKALGVGPQELWNLRSEVLTGRDGESTRQES